MNLMASHKEVRQFIGLLNYYGDMQAGGSHTLVPLTKIIPSKVKYKWTKIGQDNFE